MRARGTRVSLEVTAIAESRRPEPARDSPVPPPVLLNGTRLIQDEPEPGEIVAYLSAVTRGARTITLISLGRVRGVWRPEGWERRSTEPPPEEMELAMDYLVNRTRPFDLDEPFGLYRHADHSLYIDTPPLQALKIVLRHITLLEDGRVAPEDRRKLRAFFAQQRWQNLLRDTERELVERPKKKQPKPSDVVFPVPGHWAPLDSAEERAQQAAIDAGAAQLMQQEAVAAMAAGGSGSGSGSAPALADEAKAAAVGGAGAGAETDGGREEKEENKGQEQEQDGEAKAEPLQLRPLAPSSAAASSPPSPARDDDDAAFPPPLAPQGLAAAVSSSSIEVSSSASGGQASAGSSAPPSPGRPASHTAAGGATAAAAAAAAAADEAEEEQELGELLRPVAGGGATGAAARSPPPTPPGTDSPALSPTDGLLGLEEPEDPEGPAPMEEEAQEEEGTAAASAMEEAAAATGVARAREAEQETALAEEAPAAKRARGAGQEGQGEEEKAAQAPAAAAAAAAPAPQQQHQEQPAAAPQQPAQAAAAAPPVAPAPATPPAPAAAGGAEMAAAVGAGEGVGAALPYIDPARQAALAPPPDKGWAVRIMAFQLGMDAFKRHVKSRKAQFEAIEEGAPMREIGLWACGQLIDHADNAHDKLAGYLEQAIWDGILPPPLGAASGDARTIALWQIMINCLMPITEGVRHRAFDHASHGRLPPPPVNAPAQVGPQQAAPALPPAQPAFQPAPPQPPQYAPMQLQMPMAQMPIPLQQPAMGMPPYNPFAAAAAAGGGGYAGYYNPAYQQAAQANYQNYYAQHQQQQGQGYGHGQASPAHRAAL